MRIISLFIGIIFLIGVTYAQSCTSTSWSDSILPQYDLFKLENRGKYVIKTVYGVSTTDNVEVSVEVCTGADTANVVFNLDNNKAGYVHLLVDTVIPTTTAAPVGTTTTTKAPDTTSKTISPNAAGRMNPLSSLFVMLIPLFFINRRLSIVLAVLVAIGMQVSHAQTNTQITITVKFPSKVIQNCEDGLCFTIKTGAEYYLGSKKFIALDGASPYSNKEDECQSAYITIPTGWSLASEADLKALVATDAFPSTTCFVGAASVDQSGDSCSAAVENKTANGDVFFGSSKCGRIILTAALPTGKLTNFKLGMKLAVFSTGSTSDAAGALLAKTMLRATGILFDELPLMNAAQTKKTYDKDLPLFDAEGVPQYYGIVIAGELLYNPGSGFVSILSDAQKTQLALYKRLFSVREVILNSDPTGIPGLTVAAAAAETGATLAIDSTWAAANPTIVSGLNYAAARFDLKSEFTRKASVPASASDVTPIVRYKGPSDTGATSSSDYALGAIVKDPSAQTESMQFWVGQSVYLTHGAVLSNVWINWLTRGVWVGSRRIYLSPQIDDLFLGTEEYKNPSKVNRMNGADLTAMKNWLPTLNAKVPGSNITLEFGFNMAEHIHTQDPGNTLLLAVQNLYDDFFWESHTYTHLDLTCPESDCAKYGATTYEKALEELTNNIDETKDILFKDLGGLDNPYYSADCMITPKISGLLNPNALRALVKAGITCVVGDNSVVALQQENPYLGEWTTKEKHGYEGVYIIPRFATEIYYDTATADVAIKQYNARYGKNGSITSLGKDFTMEEVLDREAGVTLNWLSQYRHDPYMFHQGNIMQFSYSAAGRSGQWSLVSLWLDHLIELYKKTFTFPIRTTAHKYLRDQYLARRERDSCGIEASVTITNGALSAVNLASENSCEAGVTGLTACASGDSKCRVEPYGPDSTVWAKISSSRSATVPASGQWN